MIPMTSAFQVRKCTGISQPVSAIYGFPARLDFAFSASPATSNIAIASLRYRFVNALVYHGLSMLSSNLAGDRYFNFFLSGLVELPADILCMFVIQK